MLKITYNIHLDENEIQISFIRAPGPGGQNVNKVATAALLRFDAAHSPSLPDDVRTRLLALPDTRITQQGEIIIKATRHRTQERNRQDAILRLLEIIRWAAIVPKKRKKTKPTRASQERRLNTKKLHGKAKALRNRIVD